MTDYYLRLVELPRKVEGVSVLNDDGSFDIYINSLLPPRRRQEVLEHELAHIRREHFYLDMPLSLMERQAEGEHVNVVLHPPEGLIPCFSSEAALERWLRNLCAQQRLDLDSLYF